MKKKVNEWINIIRILLEIYEIYGCFLTTSEKEYNPSTISFTCLGRLNDFFLFSNNIFRTYLITELCKIVNPDRDSLTLFSFMNDHYKDKDKNILQWKEFGNWKKKTEAFREKLRLARIKFSAHLDKRSFHDEQYFGLYIEDLGTFLKRTFLFINVLYENDEILKESFDREITVIRLFEQNPFQVANSNQRVMINRIRALKKCCSGNQYPTSKMTKKGYKNKFIITFLVLSIGLYLFFLEGSRNFTVEALIGQYVYSAIYMFIPSAIIALIWEFFNEK